MTNCLLFDCDGTLVDSERISNQGLAIKFADFGVNLDVDDLVMRFRGWKLANILEELEQDHDIKLPAPFRSFL